MNALLIMTKFRGRSRLSNDPVPFTCRRITPWHTYIRDRPRGKSWRVTTSRASLFLSFLRSRSPQLELLRARRNKRQNYFFNKETRGRSAESAIKFEEERDGDGNYSLYKIEERLKSLINYRQRDLLGADTICANDFALIKQITFVKYLFNFFIRNFSSIPDETVALVGKTLAAIQQASKG